MKQECQLLTLYSLGYHLPRVRARDNFYTKLENERAAASGR